MENVIGGRRRPGTTMCEILFTCLRALRWSGMERERERMCERERERECEQECVSERREREGRKRENV